MAKRSARSVRSSSNCVARSACLPRRKTQIDESISRYLNQLDSAGRQEPSEGITSRVRRLKEKIGKLKEEMARLNVLETQMLAAADEPVSLTDPDARSCRTWGQLISLRKSSCSANASSSMPTSI